MLDETDVTPPGSFGWESEQIESAGIEAAAIGGVAGDEYLDPALRPLVEAGEGESEGFELAEEQLIKAAEFGDPDLNPLRNAYAPEREATRLEAYGEADHEASSQTTEDDR